GRGREDHVGGDEAGRRARRGHADRARGRLGDQPWPAGVRGLPWVAAQGSRARAARGGVVSSHVEGRFAGAAGGQIYWQGWVPSDITGVVVIAHGLAEHGGRYAHVGARLAQDGYATYVADHRGHGKSDGVKGNIDRMSTVVTDLE